MKIPAICDNCSTIFNSGIVVANSYDISFSGCIAGPCPKCGSNGHVPDGLYNIVNETIEILRAPDISVREMLKFAQKLKTGLESNFDHHTIIEEIENEHREFERLSDILPKNRNELYAFITIIIMVIQLLISTHSSQNDTTNINYNITNNYTETIINNIYNDINYSEKAIKNLEYDINKLKLE